MTVMREALRRCGPCPLAALLLGLIAGLSQSSAALAIAAADIEKSLTITVDGKTRQIGLEEAMAALNISSVSLASSMRTASSWPAPMGRA
jgi:hypothetical protein